jgi:hypothetical protein
MCECDEKGKIAPQGDAGMNPPQAVGHPTVGMIRSQESVPNVLDALEDQAGKDGLSQKPEIVRGTCPRVPEIQANRQTWWTSAVRFRRLLGKPLDSCLRVWKANPPQAVGHLYLIAVLILALVCSCAKEVIPPGGPPDVVPPSILATTPTDGATGVATTSPIEVQFSERIAAKLAISALFLSPPLSPEPQVKVKSDRLIITPAGPLDSGRTYVVTIGASLADLNGNRMTSSSAIAFSTGESIDSATVRGTVYDQLKPQANFRVFAYEAKPALLDSLFAWAPTYITESGKDGHYEFKYMKAGEYLVLGVEDKDRDNRISGQSERVALPTSQWSALHVTLPAPDCNLQVSRYDSSDFSLILCSGTAGMLTLQFAGGKIDHVSVNIDSVAIANSAGRRFAPASLAAFEQENDRLHLWSNDLLADSSYKIYVSGLTSLEGRRLKVDTAGFDVRPRGVDVSKPSVMKRVPPSGRTLMLESETLSVVFSEPVVIQPDAARVVIDSASSISLQSLPLGDLQYGFLPADTLPAGRRLKFLLNQRVVTDAANNSPTDSLVQFEFSIASRDSFGTLTGNIIDESPDTVIVRLQGLYRKLSYTFVQTMSGDYSWQLYPDSYTLYAFADRNHNRRWDYGSLAPFMFAEPGWVLPDTVKVRARFTHEGFDLGFK